MKWTWLAAWSVVGAVACGGGTASAPAPVEVSVPADIAPDVAVVVDVEVDAGPDAAPDADPDVAPDVAPDAVPAAPAVLPAEEYCEHAVDVFCPYYLRCGRMAVGSLAECRAAFVEVCDAVYEPIYAAAAALGLLELSGPGLAACAAHLEEVSCEAQVFDLDGGCGAVWTGLVPFGGACGPGIESFVCDPASTCVLDLSFCGTCEPAAATGEACGPDLRCQPWDVCLDEVCQRRPVGGEPCDGSVPCRLGTSCVDGTCAGDTWVGPGEACGADQTCQYKSVCGGGSCVATGLAGDACGATAPCASGWCGADQGCHAFLQTGDPCGDGAECRSGACDAGACAPLELPCVGG